jgi:hypothetical protein
VRVRAAAAGVAIAFLAAPGTAPAHETASGAADAASVDAPCPGDPIESTRVITGEFGSDLQGSYVMVPFDVPAGTTAVRVKYCYDRPESPTGAQINHTLDLGLYEPRVRPGGPWGEAEFRGWGGSSHPDVTVSPQGFSTQAQYEKEPKGHVPGRTTRGFVPGPIPAGAWAAELGVAAVVTREQGDADGRVAWRLEIELSSDPAHADEPYRPASYDPAPARQQAGWYTGDLHVHAEHSSLGDATMTEVFGYAFGPLSQGGAGLDFIMLSDYVTTSHWGEVGRHQGSHPGKLIARSAEVITYRGHANNHLSLRWADHRTGPVYERRSDGRLVRLRGPRPASEIFDTVHAAGGFTQINHPTIFPSDVPLFAILCRGCPWDYGETETRYEKVDAIEVATGPAGLKAPPEPGPNPFTVTAIEFWEDALDAGHHIAAVGVSDSHNAGRAPNPVTQAPIGQATTAVFADELSEKGIQRGVEWGHTYVKIRGNDAPDLRLEARVPGTSRPTAIMGDTVDAGRVELTARVLGAAPGSGPDPYELIVYRDRTPIATVPVTGDDFTYSFTAIEHARYRLQIQRGNTIEAVATPIWIGPRTPLSVVASARRVVRSGAFNVRCRVSGTDARSCSAAVRWRPRGRRSRTIASDSEPLTGGEARLGLRLSRSARRAIRRRGRKGVRAKVVVTGTDREGRARSVTRKVRIVLGRRAVRRQRSGRGRARPRFTG